MDDQIELRGRELTLGAGLADAIHDLTAAASALLDDEFPVADPARATSAEALLRQLWDRTVAALTGAAPERLAALIGLLDRIRSAEREIADLRARTARTCSARCGRPWAACTTPPRSTNC